MIKGNERRIIVVERLNDPYFEKAMFFVRCGVREKKGGMSLSDRAQEIFDSLTKSDAEESEDKSHRKQTGTPLKKGPEKGTPLPHNHRIIRRFFSQKKGGESGR